MRIRTWYGLIFILALALFSGWVSLPGQTLDVGGFKQRFPVREGLDLQGGLQVVLQANPPAGQEVDAQTLEGTRATLERRVGGLGVSEPLIQTRGNNQIIVELPGVDDPQEAVDILQETALLEIIDPQGQSLVPGTIVNTSLGSAEDAPDAGPATPGASPGPSTLSASPIASPTASPAPEATATPTGPVYTTIVSGADLEDAFITTGDTGIERVVGFRLRGDGADRFYDFTSTHIGQPMSIVVDKQVISSPVIQAAISSEGIITGVPQDEVDDLVAQLRSGQLPVPLEVVERRTLPAGHAQDATPPAPPATAGTVGGTTPVAAPPDLDPAGCLIAPRRGTKQDWLALATGPAPDTAFATMVYVLPTPPPLPEGEPADAETREGLLRTARELAACINAGDDARLTALYTDDYWRRILPQSIERWGGTPEEVAESYAAVTARVPAERPPGERVVSVAVAGVRILPGGRVGAVTTLAYADGDLYHGFLIFARSGDRWLIDDRVLFEPGEGTPAAGTTAVATATELAQTREGAPTDGWSRWAPWRSLAPAPVPGSWRR